MRAFALFFVIGICCFHYVFRFDLALLGWWGSHSFGCVRCSFGLVCLVGACVGLGFL